MKNCKQCGGVFVSKDKRQIFCSRKCAAVCNNKTRTKSPEARLKISIGIKKYRADPSNREKILATNNKIAKALTGKLRGWSGVSKQKIWRTFDGPTEELGRYALRTRITKEQNGECGKCHLDEWLGFPIPLEIHHKDGNNQNNIRENIVALCPNCHALTDNWRGRNNKRR